MANKALDSFAGQDAGTPVAACSPPGGKWDQECVRQILCATDPAVVSDLAAVDTFVADNVMSHMWVYDGKNWVEKYDSIKGAAGRIGGRNAIEMDSCQTCEEATVFIYHEVLHTKQPTDWTVRQREMDAYTRTEEWGLKYSTRNLTQGFRKTVGGVQMVDDNAITRHVETRYAAPKPGKPQVTDHLPHETMWGIEVQEDRTILYDPITHKSSWRKSEAGDKYAVDTVFAKGSEVALDATKWKCGP